MQSIKFENVGFGYRKGQKIFRDLSFGISNSYFSGNGYVVVLMGASGSGKSTLLKLMLQTEKPQEGQVVFGTQPVMSYLPQEPVLFDHLSPLNNARYFSTIAHYKGRF